MQPNLGSGNQLLGGDANAALQEAMQRRQTGQAGATSQVTQGAATFDPATQGAPVGGAPAAPAQPNIPTSPMPFDSSESKLILSAMGSRLKALSKLQGAS